MEEKLQRPNGQECSLVTELLSELFYHIIVCTQSLSTEQATTRAMKEKLQRANTRVLSKKAQVKQLESQLVLELKFSKLTAEQLKQVCCWHWWTCC